MSGDFIIHDILGYHRSIGRKDHPVRLLKPLDGHGFFQCLRDEETVFKELLDDVCVSFKHLWKHSHHHLCEAEVVENAHKVNHKLKHLWPLHLHCHLYCSVASIVLVKD